MQILGVGGDPDAQHPSLGLDLIAEYRRFLRTSYRFLDQNLRRQFEDHLSRADVVVRGPYVTLAREFARGRNLAALVESAEAESNRTCSPHNWPFGDRPTSHGPTGGVAVYCDGFAFHGTAETLALDASKRNLLQSRGWVVVTYWGRTILKDAEACAAQVAQIYRQRVGTDL